MIIVNNEVVFNFKTKANVIQSTPFENNSSLPVSQCYVTRTKLSSINFNHEDILKIIKNLDQNKAHRLDGLMAYL